MAAKPRTSFLTCGVTTEALTGKVTTPAGMLMGPRERLVTIAGRVSSEQPYQRIRIVVVDAFIKECAAANAKAEQRVLGVGGATATILPNHAYRIVGLLRKWCTTTYVLAIRLDDLPPVRYEVHLQGIQSQSRQDPWDKNYDIILKRTPAPVTVPPETKAPPKPKGNAKAKKSSKKALPTDSAKVE